MSKLGKLVLQTQQAETAFETDALWKLNDMAEHSNPATDESNLTMLKIYAHSVAALGRNTDALVELSRSQESFTN